MKIFVDTWGWLALEDRSEVKHEAASRFYRERSRVPGCVVTSDYVLDETFTRLYHRRPFGEAWRFTEGLRGAVRNEIILLERITPERFEKAIRLRKKYADKPGVSFTDLTSFVIMQDLKIQEVLTADAHFQQVGLGFRVLPV